MNSGSVQRSAKWVGVAVMVAAVIYVVMLARGKYEWGGASPDQQTLGTVKDISQRAMEQFCTGVVVTPQATWLVGRREVQLSELEVAKGVPNLATLIPGREEEPAPSGARSLFGMASDRGKVSVISRLSAGGVFEPVAIVPDVACLRSTPDGKRVFLMTGLARPKQPNAAGASGQSAIFQSDDQGVHWQWRSQGLFPQVDIAWTLAPYFFDAQSVWAWQDLAASDSVEAAQAGLAAGLQYSPDGGETIENVRSAQKLMVSLDVVRAKAGNNARWPDNASVQGETKRHVVQLDDQHAVVWVSQSFAYAQDDGPYLDQHYHVTSQMALQRVAGQWQAGPVERLEGFAIERLLSNRSGQTVAVSMHTGQAALSVDLLNRTTLRWEPRGELPNAFAPLGASGYVREAYIGSKVLLMNVGSSHEVPRLMRPWASRPASVSGDAVFYSPDWGRQWTRLSMDGYLGLLGLDAERNRVVWARGNWYNSHDPNVFTYGLN